MSRSSHGAISELNITPLLDLAWVLLVIFILTTTAVVQGIEVDLPKSTPNDAQVDTSARIISVTKAGQVFLDDAPVRVAELEGILRGLKEAKGGKLPVILRGDQGVEYRHVVAVLDVLKRIPIEDLALVTKPADS